MRNNHRWQEDPKHPLRPLIFLQYQHHRLPPPRPEPMLATLFGCVLFTVGLILLWILL